MSPSSLYLLPGLLSDSYTLSVISLKYLFAQNACRRALHDALFGQQTRHLNLFLPLMASTSNLAAIGVPDAPYELPWYASFLFAPTT